MAGRSLGDNIKSAILNKSPKNRAKNSKTPEAPIEIQDSPENKEIDDEDLADVIANKTKDLSKKEKVELKYGVQKKGSPSEGKMCFYFITKLFFSFNLCGVHVIFEMF